MLELDFYPGYIVSIMSPYWYYSNLNNYIKEDLLPAPTPIASAGPARTCSWHQNYCLHLLTVSGAGPDHIAPSAGVNSGCWPWSPLRASSIHPAPEGWSGQPLPLVPTNRMSGNKPCYHLLLAPDPIVLCRQQVLAGPVPSACGSGGSGAAGKQGAEVGVAGQGLRGWTETHPCAYSSLEAHSSFLGSQIRALGAYSNNKKTLGKLNLRDEYNVLTSILHKCQVLQRQSEEVSHIEEDKSDMTSKFNRGSWIGYWNRKKKPHIIFKMVKL